MSRTVAQHAAAAAYAGVVLDARPAHELEAAIAVFPADVRAMLALGPMPEPGCRICETLDAFGRRRGGLNGVSIEERDASLVLLDHHEISADQMRDLVGALELLVGDDEGRSLGWELTGAPPLRALISSLVWARCQTIYLVAGWRPRPTEEDA